MTSSTDVMSSASIHSEISPPRSHKASNSSVNKTPQPTEEVQLEIEELIDHVPQVAKTFSVLDKIGSGTFSSVYVAKLKDSPHTNEHFALKHIIPTSHPSRIESELRCLYEIGGIKNVMGVKACFRERDHVVIVMPHFPHDRFQDYVRLLTLPEVREYLKNLLIALHRVHEVDIIHRDVKPSNFLFSRQRKQYALVDFGLAQKAPVVLQRNQEEGNVSDVKHEIKKPVRQDVMSKTRTSPKKRKHTSEEVENLVEAPQKRRQITENQHRSGTVGLTVIDTNKQIKESLDPKSHETLNQLGCKMEALNPSNINMTPPTPGLAKPAFIKTVKSPRRILLTKRTLDPQRRSLFDEPKRDSQQSGLRKSPVVVLERGGKSMYKMVAPTSCQCFGKPVICTICMARSGQHAPRAGTPGFRAPEVLMKCPDQTTAVDIWSAGVIFLSLLSGRYPFFKAPDDMTALAQIISVVGSDTMQAAAESIGKNMMCSPRTPAIDLKIMCEQLRKNAAHIRPSKKAEVTLGKENEEWTSVPASAVDLLKKLMDVNPYTRITADGALLHPFFTDNAIS